MRESEIIEAIESRVRESKKVDYSIWTIGITDDTERRRTEHKSDGHDVRYWMDWRADAESIARSVEKHFLDKGMKGGEGGGKAPTYVYIF